MKIKIKTWFVKEENGFYICFKILEQQIIDTGRLIYKKFHDGINIEICISMHPEICHEYDNEYSLYLRGTNTGRDDDTFGIYAGKTIQEAFRLKKRILLTLKELIKKNGAKK